MSKITLGKRPEHFTPVTVEFPMPDGTTGTIEATFKYRTREEYGAMIDKAGADAKPLATGEAAPTIEALAASGVHGDAHLTFSALHAWDLDEPLTFENVYQLANEVPAAITALLAGYRRMVSEGRLGN